MLVVVLLGEIRENAIRFPRRGARNINQRTSIARPLTALSSINNKRESLGSQQK